MNKTNEKETQMELMDQFRYVSSLQHRYYSQLRQERGNSGDPHRGQGRLLALLKMKPETTQKDLAFLLGMRKQSVGELLAKLEDKGFITRTQSAEDKRVLIITLTEAGKTEAENNEISTEKKDMFAILTDEEKEQLRTILAKMIDSLEAETGTTYEDAWNERMQMRGGYGGRRGHRQPRERRSLQTEFFGKKEEE